MHFTTTYVKGQLGEYQKDGYKNVPNGFIYQFGPYLSMTYGYEKPVDEISKSNHLMKVIQYAAYIQRSFMIKNKNPDWSGKEKREFVKDMINEVSKEFPSDSYPDEYTALCDFIASLPIYNRFTKDTESVMTDVSPVVPYQNSIRKIYVEEAEDTEDSIKASLYKNLPSIMSNSDLNYLSMDPTQSLHNILMQNIPESVKDYYTKVIRYNQKPSKISTEAMCQFYDLMFGNNDNYKAFEATMNAMASSIEILDESLYDVIE